MGRADGESFWTVVLLVLVAGPWQGSHSFSASMRACPWGWHLARVGARPQPENCGAPSNEGAGLKSTLGEPGEGKEVMWAYSWYCFHVAV